MNTVRPGTDKDEALFGFAPAWLPATALSTKAHSALLNWLQHSGSLTTRLIHHSDGDFAVQILSQHWGRASFSEARVLGLRRPGARVLVREVILRGRGEAWVFARSILPRSSLTGSLRRMRKLDNQPLGAWLFKQPNMQRDPLQVSRFSPDDARLPLNLGIDDFEGVDRVLEKTLWGRRSVFYIHGKPLLVGEVFLPAFVRTLNPSM